MSVLLNWVLPSGAAQQLMLDASVQEQHTAMAQVTEHQVEQGVSITDHVRPMPKRISIEGIITNTPIVVPTTYMQGVTAQTTKSQQTVNQSSPTSPPATQVQFTTLQFQGQIDRVKAVYADLVTACLNGYLFSVTTSLASYTNMVAVSLAVPRNVDTGNVLQFTIDMQEIRIVQTSTTTIAVPQSVTSANKGKKTPQTLDPTKDAQKVGFALQQLQGFGVLK